MWNGTIIYEIWNDTSKPRDALVLHVHQLSVYMSEKLALLQSVALIQTHTGTHVVIIDYLGLLHR